MSAQEQAALAARPRVLCVDDEIAVLEGLALTLRRRYQLVFARNAEQALQAVATQGPFAAVLSDMRMPGMGGAALLARVRELDPSAVRLLLTGNSDMQAAVAAVNDGQVFRFLTKPCSSELLQQAVEDAVAQHRRLCAERELMERTLRGAVQALADVLALTDPEAYGRAGRIQQLSLALAERMGLQPAWPMELAAMLLPIGRASLPPDLIKRSRYGDPLSEEEGAMLARVPEVTDRLLSSIPGLESVRDILREAARGGGRSPGDAPQSGMTLRSARALRLAMDWEELESRGLSASVALAELAGRKAAHEPALLAALEAIKGGAPHDIEVRGLSLRLLQVDMVLAEDLHTVGGQLLASRGYRVTAGFVERARNFKPGLLREPILVILPQAGKG